MTAAFQSGQFHTGETDQPASVQSVFTPMADAPGAGVQAEESVGLALAEAAKGAPDAETEPEATPEVDMTVAELKAELDDAGVEYPSDARKPELVELAVKEGLVEVVEDEPEAKKAAPKKTTK